MGGAPAAAEECLCCWAAARYMRAITRVDIYYICQCGLRMCVDSTGPFYLTFSGWLAGGMLGEGGHLGSCLALVGGGLAGRT